MKTQKFQKATVHWYDDQSAEGLIKLSNGDLVYIHGSAIVDKKPIVDGQAVEVVLFEDINWRQVSKLRS